MSSSSGSNANKQTTPTKPSDTRGNAAKRLDGGGMSPSPNSKLQSALSVGVGVDKNKATADEALKKGSSSQEKRK